MNPGSNYIVRDNSGTNSENSVSFLIYNWNLPQHW